MDEHPPLPHSELKEAPIEKVILHNLRFAYTQAKKCADRYPGLSEEEVIEGMLYAATEAANRWKPDESKITSYMSTWIRAVIKDMSNDNRHAITRNTMHIWKTYKINNFVDEFKQAENREPTDTEIAEGTNFSKTTIYNVRNLGIKSVTSFNMASSDGEDDHNLNEIIADETAKSPLDETCDSDISIILTRLIAGLDPIEQEVINRRWYGDHKYKKIAEDLNIPYPKVKRIEDKAKDKLKKELEAIEKG
jgi:RNA polymerase sigma factor (sigma-70 family)